MAQVAAGASQKGLSQTKEALLKSYQKRLKDDIKSMVENYVEIIKLGKVYRCILFRSGYVHDDVYEFGQFPMY